MAMTLDPRLLGLAQSNAPREAVEALLASGSSQLTASDRAALTLAVDDWQHGTRTMASFRGLNQKECDQAGGAGTFRGLNR